MLLPLYIFPLIYRTGLVCRGEEKCVVNVWSPKVALLIVKVTVQLLSYLAVIEKCLMIVFTRLTGNIQLLYNTVLLLLHTPRRRL